MRFQAGDFLWATGIEDTFIPQTRAGHRTLDEYELMGHYEHWREDFSCARDVGVQAIRWGVPWYRVEPQRGHFNWEWVDEVLPHLVNDLGLMPIVDLMHYGCPLWLHREFANDDYPDAVAAYASAFAHRYRGLVSWYTPLNEPLVNSLLCGHRGVWPPYLRGEPGYIRIMLQLVCGMQRTVRAIKRIDPTAVMVFVEALGIIRAGHEDLASLAQEEQQFMYLSLDLLLGHVTPLHPLFPRLVRAGALPRTLASIVDHAVELDVLGLNFYPQWSTRDLYLNRNGRLADRAGDTDGAGFLGLIANLYERYSVPLMITETSAVGSDDIRATWLESSVAAVRHARSRGIPVMGYTWFPLLTMVDWRYRFGRGPVTDYYVELGLYRGPNDAERPRWRSTPLVERFKSVTSEPMPAIGSMEGNDSVGTVA